MGELPFRSMQRVAENVSGGVIEERGHWVPEEKPEWIATRIVEFHKSATL